MTTGSVTQAEADLTEARTLLAWAIGYIEYEYITPSLLHDKREGRNDQIMFERSSAFIKQGAE